MKSYIMKNGKASPYLQMITKLSVEAEARLRDALKSKTGRGEVEDMMRIVKYLRDKTKRVTKEAQNVNYE